MEDQLAALLPVFVLVAVGSILPILGAYRVRGGWLAGITALAVLVSGALVMGSLYEIPGLRFMPQVGATTAPLISYELLEWTPFVAVFDLVFLAVLLVVALASPRYVASRHQGEYYSLLVLSTVGMMMVAASRDLITLFVGLELSSFCTYALAGFFKGRLASSEAAVKYFLIGSISSSLALFGISIVYGLTGGTSFADLAALWCDPLAGGGCQATGYASALLTGGFALGVFVWGLLLVGFGYKIAMVPFHNYAVDVYDGAPSTVGGFLAAGSKQMGFAALFKVFLIGMFAVKANWDVAVGILAVLTMVVGNVAALAQTNIKRLLAYSSIAQAGYILIALAVGTPYALAGGIFHIITYAFMQAGAFVALAAASTWGTGETMDDWKGMGKRAPMLALAMTLFMFSFAGIPPLAGFASKFVLFSSAIQAGGWYIWLAVAGILTSAISLAYYWRLVRVMYVEEGVHRPVTITAAAGISVLIAAVATVLLGLFWAPAFDLAAEAAQNLFAAVVVPR